MHDVLSCFDDLMTNDKRMFRYLCITRMTSHVSLCFPFVFVIKSEKQIIPVNSNKVNGNIYK